MRDNDRTFFGCMGLVAYMAVAVVLTQILYGWALSKMWAWFMVPVFSLPALGVAAAIGVASTVRLITYQPDADKSEDEDATERLIKSTIKAALLPLFVLGFGWCVKQFM